MPIQSGYHLVNEPLTTTTTTFSFDRKTNSNQIAGQTEAKHIEATTYGSWYRVSARSGAAFKTSKKGLKPINPFEFQSDKAVKMPSLLVGQQFGNGTKFPPTKIVMQEHFFNDISQAPSPLYNMINEDIRRVEDRAAMKTLRKVKDQSVNLVQFYAERGMTAKTVASTISSVAKMLMALKKGRIADALRAVGIHSPRPGAGSAQLDDLAGMWLALVYGWRPLINDVWGAAEFLNKKSRLAPSAEEKVISVSMGENSRVTHSGAGTSVYVIDELSYKRVVKYCIYFTSSSPMGKTLNELGFTNPATIAWELMPWSFVIDWFIPIGQYINSLDATFGTQFGRGCLTFHDVAVSTRTCHFNNHYSGGMLWSGTTKMTRTAIRTRRTLLNSFPATRLPCVKNPISTEHMLNALALLQRLRK